MIDPARRAIFDQHAALFAETFPPLLWGFYRGLTAQGFSEVQAMTLTAMYVQAIVQAPPRPEEGGPQP